MYELKFQINGLPKMANGNKGGHWGVKAKATAGWKLAVAKCIMGRVPNVPCQKVRCVFTRCSSVEPDDDGLVIGFKAVRDALVRYGVVVDDKRKNMQTEYHWEPAPARKGKIRVEVYELPGSIETATT